MANPFDAIPGGHVKMGTGPRPVSATMFVPPKEPDTGFLGGIMDSLFGSRASRSPRHAAIQMQRESSAASGRVTAELAERMQTQGMTPQAAFLDYIKSPGGAEMFAMDNGSMMKGIQDFMTSMSPTRSTINPGQSVWEQDPTKKDPRVVAQKDNWVAETIEDPRMGIKKIQYRNTATGEVSQTPRSNSVVIQGSPATPAQPPAQGQLDMQAFKTSIVGIETPGHAAPYTAVGPESKWPDLVKKYPDPAMRHPYGKYQVMGFNVADWTTQAMGKPYSLDDFKANKDDVQERVFEDQTTKNYARTGNVAQTASLWFTGRRNAPLAKDVNGMTGERYASTVEQSYNRLTKQQGAVPVQGAPATSPGQTATKMPGVHRTGVTPTVTPAEEMTSWTSVNSAFGIGPGVVSALASFAGQVIPEIQKGALIRQIQQNRQRLRLDLNDAVRTYVNSIPGMQGDSVRAQAEMDLMRKDLNLDPRFWKSEMDGYNALLVIDERLRTHLKAAEEISNSAGKVHVDEIKKADIQAVALRNMIARLGVPPPGDPKRDNAPTTGAWELLKKLEEGDEGTAVRKGVGDMQGKPQDPQKAFDGIMKDIGAGTKIEQDDPRVQSLFRSPDKAKAAELLRKISEEIKKKREGGDGMEDEGGGGDHEKSITIEMDGRFFNFPSVVNGREVSKEEVKRLYTTGKLDPLGGATYNSLKSATDAARHRSRGR